MRDAVYPEELLSSDFLFEDNPSPVTPADRPTCSVYLRGLPVEISDESVRTAFDAFGDVFFPSVPPCLKIFQASVMVPLFCKCPLISPFRHP